jgi:hypothetical protein
VGRILTFEGILNDPLGALLAVLVFQVIQTEQVETAVSLVILSVAKAALWASALGIGAAFGYTFVRKRDWLPESLQNAVLLPLVLGVYALAGAVQHESGLLAVTIMGIALASQRRVNMEASVEFTSHARTLLISVLFVLLAARMQLSNLAELRAEALFFVAIVIGLVRPLAVFLATLGTNLSWRERVFLAVVAPRGIVAAAVSSVFALRLTEAGYEHASLLLPVTFLLIASCVTVYGLLARPIVRLLRLGQRHPQGLLVLGANPVARTLSRCLQSQGVRALLVDSNRHAVRKARLAGLEVEDGQLLSSRVLDRLDLDGIGHFLALSDGDDQNTLAVTHFRKVFGSNRAYQLDRGGSSASSEGSYAESLRGAHVAGGRTYDELSALVYRGAEAKATLITDEFSFQDYRRVHPGAVPLFSLSGAGALRVLDGDAAPPSAGERVVSLVQMAEADASEWSPRNERCRSTSAVPGRLP